ncbi:MAG: transporter [Gemmatimonadota bacterium]
MAGSATRRRATARRSAAATLVGLGMTALAQGGAAQESGAIVTDRPDQTESARSVRAGRFQLELGWLLTAEDAGGSRARTHAIAGALLRIGLGAGVEARVGFDGWIRGEERPGPAPSAEVIREGAGDAALGLKWALRDGERLDPAVALLGAVSLPVGAGELSSGRADPDLRLLVSHDLADRVSLGYNLGVAWETETTAGGGGRTLTDALYTLSLGLGLAETVGVFMEGFGFLGLSADRPDRHSLDGGLTIRLRENLQLDASAGVGLNEAAEDWLVGAGVSFRLPR